MDDVTLFNDFTTSSGYGSRLDPTRLKSGNVTVLCRQAARAAASIRAARARHPGLPPIHFDWIESDKANAVAFRHHDRHFIGITSGAVLATHGLFTRMLADPHLLPKIGGPGEKVASAGGVAPAARDAATAQEAGTAIVRDASREQYALLLENSAIDFLVAHEIAHIANGHLGWASSRGRPFVAEDLQSDKLVPRLATQAMEVDADRAATVMRVGSIHRMLSDLSRTLPPPWSLFYEDPPTALYHWSFAVNTLFWVFRGEPGAEGYPALPLRQACVLSTAGQVTEQWEADLVDGCTKSMADAALEAEAALAAVSGTSRSPVQADSKQHRATQQRDMAAVREHWDSTLRAELRPYAYRVQEPQPKQR